jgi:ADP-heptose:LPS heptosyltransferase
MGNINLRCSSKGIGDMVCGLYVAQSLKERFPKYNIVYYVLQPQWFKYITEVNVKHYLEIKNVDVSG